ncbi:hypothetical protein CAL7716_081110 [Calothrix sp. PCC 7716]|nr:hypothetical protein CAL7716_081110 [Calothrix sp. PCC 7716]
MLNQFLKLSKIQSICTKMAQIQVNSEIKGEGINIYKLFKSTINIVLMFTACLLFCHSPALINMVLGHLSH